jgi:hypothetical protein
MFVLNFAHPLTDEHIVQIEVIAASNIDNIQTIPVQVNENEPLEAQIRAIVDAVQLTSEEWQTRSLLINPPGYTPAACVLLAELHGRIGHFPAIIHLRPILGPVTTYEVAESLNLQTIRETSRKRR